MRELLFWAVCIPVRYGLYLYARTSSVLLRAFAAVVGTRWLLGYENGNEGFFGGPAWWARSRPLHGALWLGYAATDRASLLLYDVYLGVANKFLNSALTWRT